VKARQVPVLFLIMCSSQWVDPVPVAAAVEVVVPVVAAVNSGINFHKNPVS